MEIKDAIEHARQVADGCGAGSRDCAYQHDQLADWLEELVAYKAAMPLERTQELAQAERDGRLVVLPCKVGDTVYFPVLDRFDSAEVDHFDVLKDKVMLAWAQYDRSYESTELWDMDEVDCAEVGTTVFLTRQEAEAAVEKMKGGPDNGLE